MNRKKEWTIQQKIDEQIQNNPDKIAISFNHTSISYRELGQKANQFARYLQTYGFKKETIVAICMDRSDRLLIAILGILKAGYCYLPIDTQIPIERLRYIIEDADTPILITEHALEEKFLTITTQKIVLDKAWQEVDKFSNLDIANSVDQDNLAYVIYTSGSTGKPKGVLIEHGSVINYINWLRAYTECQVGDKIDFSSSIAFDMAVTTTIASLALGLEIVICPDHIKKDTGQFLAHLKNNKINIIKLTPSYFKVLFQEAENQSISLPDLQIIILGGEILYTKDCLAWLALYPQHTIFNEYGPTETTVAVTQYKISSQNKHALQEIVPIGKPEGNIQCLLMSENKEEIISSNETGELYISGECLARGYLNQPELTATQFINYPSGSSKKWYKTGDLCRYMPDKNIEFLRRIDDQVKIRGYRIEIGEITSQLSMHPQIRTGIVLANQDTENNSYLIAYFIPRDEAHLPNQQALRIFLGKTLPEYMIPSIFIPLDKFPLNENGKLDKSKLPKGPTDVSQLMELTPMEQQLVDIWRKIFSNPSINKTSNFFELGGHSLLAARMIIEIENCFNKRIRLEDLYNSPCIHQLTTIIEKAPTNKNKTVTQSNNGMGRIIPLSDFQFMFWLSHFFEPKVKKLNIVARRRLTGKLDMQALQFAIDSVTKKHSILSYQVAKFIPALFFKPQLPPLNEQDLSTYSSTEVDIILSRSLDKLIHVNMWQKHQPLIMANLFHLSNARSELQISVAHVVFDDMSEDILFSELSDAYLKFQRQEKINSSTRSFNYIDYVSYERNTLNKNIKRDIRFWREYLADTQLLMLPENSIVHNKQNDYSTYLVLSTSTLNKLQEICKYYALTITDLLCATVTLALKSTAGDINDNIFINIIRSTRDHDVFNKMIGCFLRLDPIKVNLQTHLSLIQLAKEIQQSRIFTEEYQACSGMAKLACLEKTYHKNKIKNVLTNYLSKIYCKLFSRFKINPAMLRMYGRLNSLKSSNRFLVNINILNNFTGQTKPNSLFGMDLEKTIMHQYDLSNIDNVLEFCFLKDENLDKIYLVVSGNLTSSFRTNLGETILKIMDLQNAKKMEEYLVI